MDLGRFAESTDLDLYRYYHRTSLAIVGDNQQNVTVYFQKIFHFPKKIVAAVTGRYRRNDINHL